MTARRAFPGEAPAAARSAEPVILGVTGASGAIYALRLLRALLLAGSRVNLIFSDYGLYLIKLELGLTSVSHGKLEPLRTYLDVPEPAWQRVRVFRNHDLAAEPASGSSRFRGVVICPCSMKNVAAVAHGLSATLLQRAADVALKERRPLILVPRETPLNLIHLRNMARLAQAGATIVPAMPAFYQLPRTFEDLGDFIAARVMDHLGIEHDLVPRWDEAKPRGRGAAPGADESETAEGDGDVRTAGEAVRERLDAELPVGDQPPGRDSSGPDAGREAHERTSLDSEAGGAPGEPSPSLPGTGHARPRRSAADG